MEELTIVRVEKQLVKKIKVAAAKSEKTMQEWVKQALTQALKNNLK